MSPLAVPVEARRRAPSDLDVAADDPVPADRPHVVVVPGLAVARYLDAPDDLVARWAVVDRLVLPAVGAGPGRRFPGVPALGEAVASWLDDHATGPVLLAGQSLGTQVCARAAVLRPDLVAGLFLAGPTVDPSQRSLPRLVRAWLRDGPREPASLVAVDARDQRRVSPLAVLRACRSAIATPIERDLVRLRHDVVLTVARGERDPMSSQVWARELADRPNAIARLVPGGAHAFPYSHPDVWDRLLRDVARRAGVLPRAAGGRHDRAQDGPDAQEDGR